jgi:hypothetical protein
MSKYPVEKSQFKKEEKMARVRKLRDYMGFEIVAVDGYKYMASKKDAPPIEKRDACLTFRSNSLRELKKKVCTYVQTGRIRDVESLAADDAWIIAVCNTDADGVVIRKAFGSEEKIKKVLVGMLLEDKENDPDAYDYGTESPDAIKKEQGALNAYATYTDYHIDYAAMRVEDIKNVADGV